VPSLPWGRVACAAYAAGAAGSWTRGSRGSSLGWVLWRELTSSSSTARLSSRRETCVARDRQLLAHGYIAQNQADTDQANLVAAQTTLDGARTAVSQARAQIATAYATQQA
jgi:hypothetical protein